MEVYILQLATISNLLYCLWGKKIVTIHWAGATLFLSSIFKFLFIYFIFSCAGFSLLHSGFL